MKISSVPDATTPDPKFNVPFATNTSMKNHVPKKGVYITNRRINLSVFPAKQKKIFISKETTPLNKNAKDPT